MNTQHAPKITVIIPTYNYAEFIGDALLSVRAQTYTNWECLVIDDASTDGTAGIVKEHASQDPRIRYIRLDRNSGVSAARNRGFEEVRGEFIQLLDADDVIAPGKLAAQVSWLDQHDEVGVLYSNYFAFTGNPSFDREGEYRADECLNGSGDMIVSRLLRGNIFRLNTVLFRKHILHEVVGFRAGFRYVEDWDFWLRIAAKGFMFRFLDEPLAISGVRANPKSLSSDKSAMSDHYLPVLQHLWVHERLSVINQVSLLGRYVFFLLDRLFLRKGRVIFLRDGIVGFLIVIIPFALLALPFWPFYKARQVLTER